MVCFRCLKNRGAHRGAPCNTGVASSFLHGTWRRFFIRRRFSAPIACLHASRFEEYRALALSATAQNKKSKIYISYSRFEPECSPPSARMTVFQLSHYHAWVWLQTVKSNRSRYYFLPETRLEWAKKGNTKRPDGRPIKKSLTKTPAWDFRAITLIKNIGSGHITIQWCRNNFVLEVEV